MTTFYLLLDFSNKLNLPKENMILRTSFEWIAASCVGSSLLFGKDKNWRNNFVFLIQGREKREIVNLIGKGFLERSSQNWHTLVLSAKKKFF